jgi:hypothetical protein
MSTLKLKEKRSHAPSQSEMAEIEQERDAARKALEERRQQLKAEEDAKNKEQEKKDWPKKPPNVKPKKPSVRHKQNKQQRAKK